MLTLNKRQGRGPWGFQIGQDPQVSSNTCNPGWSVPQWKQDYYNLKLPLSHTVRSGVQAHPLPPRLPTQLFPGLLGLSPGEHEDLFFHPAFIVRLVCLGISSVNKGTEICQIMDKINQLTDIIGDTKALQMIFIILQTQSMPSITAS